MTKLLERDAMVCRWCGHEERASEGYPCARCGTFLCIICTFRGHSLCLECSRLEASCASPPPPPVPEASSATAAPESSRRP